jgi:hypothetical protein
MRKVFLVPGVSISTLCAAQIDKDQLALAVDKADDANTAKLKEYIWKRKSDVSINGGSTTLLNMPAQNMKMDAVIQDYSKRVN